MDAERQLSGGELSSLAERPAGTTEPAEALILRDAMVRGFYGAQPRHEDRGHLTHCWA